MPHFWVLTALSQRAASLQAILNFDGWNGYPQFETEQGLGRVALVASAIGVVLGIHLLLCAQLVLDFFGFISITSLGKWKDETLQMAIQWTVYVIALCTFHLGEFFITALFNPSVASSNSFMVNHSKAYTVAALVSWAEFLCRILFFPYVNSTRIFCAGIFVVVGGQLTRATAMVTCGESFNHYIQRDKKDNHVLVTHGIYCYLRHPSYMGFFYWAVGTQLLLCNPLSSALYTAAAWTFFRHRIEYEEKILRELFPGAYDTYAANTYVGIPFVTVSS